MQEPLSITLWLCIQVLKSLILHIHGAEASWRFLWESGTFQTLTGGEKKTVSYSVRTSMEVIGLESLRWSLLRASAAHTSSLDLPRICFKLGAQEKEAPHIEGCL